MSRQENSTDSSRKHQASLISLGARSQFGISIVLISVIPTLALVYLVLGDFLESAPNFVQWTILATVVGVVCLGYVLLSKYPRTIIRLRRYLKRIVSGELPDAVRLVEAEDDIAAIAKYLDMVVFETRSRIATIENQKEALINAERQRVMIESLGTACHHLGQPATVITAYLGILKKEPLSKDARANLDKCLESAEAMRDIFQKLQNVSEYRTVPYLPLADGNGKNHGQIVKI